MKYQARIRQVLNLHKSLRPMEETLFLKKDRTLHYLKLFNREKKQLES